MSDQQNPPAAPTPAVAQEAAELEYGRILSAFDVEQKSDADRKTMLAAIVAGRVTFDDGSEELTYRLARPVQYKSGTGSLDQIVFREPTSKELEVINRGTKVAMNVEGEKMAMMDMGDTFAKTILFLTKICGVELGLAWRLKARDMAVIKVICDFFA